VYARDANIHIREALRPTTIIEGMREQRYGNALQDLARPLTTTRQPEMQDLVEATRGEQTRRAATDVVSAGGSSDGRAPDCRDTGAAPRGTAVLDQNTDYRLQGRADHEIHA
jgi:hypothetical protein